MIKIGFIFLFFVSLDVVSANLPVEHEAVRLMLAVESSIEHVEWDKALKQLQTLGALKVTPPEDYYYFNGLVNLKLEHHAVAEESLETYVVSVGKEGKYYIEALKLITLLSSRAPTEEATSEASQGKPSSLQSSEERTGYVKSLQALYLTNDPVKALVMQINSLLSVHAYSGQRVKKVGAKSGISYVVSVNNTQLGLQERSYENGFPSLTATKLNVHGLDPFLRYDCEKQSFSCSLYHPADAHLVWIKIDNDHLVARELADALTKLIQYLQTN